MFLRYRIMKSLKCDSRISIEALHNKLKIHNPEAFAACLYSLSRDGFISINDKGVSLLEFSSFRDYKHHVSKTVFDYSVSASAIVVAITSILQLFR